MQFGVDGLLSRGALAEPDRIALSEASSGRTLTWRQFDALATEVAAGLLAEVEPTEDDPHAPRVAIVMTNRIEFLAAYLGTLRAGLIAVPVNPRSTTGDLLRILGDSGAQVVFADDVALPTVRAAVGGFRDAGRAITVGVVGEKAQDDERAWDAMLSAVPVAPPSTTAEDIAVLLYTGGATGFPRGAMLSHRALRANIDQVAALEPPLIVGQDVVFGVLPLFHVYGLNAVLGQVLLRHARLVLVDGFETEAALDIIEDEAVSVVPVAPVVIAHWMHMAGIADRVGPVRLILSGSAPLSADLAASFTTLTQVPIFEGYGMTEASPVVTSTGPRMGAWWTESRDAGALGLPLPGIELRVGATTATDVADGFRTGEVEVRGPNLFSGYWPDGAEGPDAEGWFATGDIGYLDDAGELHLIDRVKDLVVVAGFNVYPSEVEDVIAEIADVASVAVVGASVDERSDVVVAYVRPEAHADRTTLVQAVHEYCAQKLARYKRPTVVHLVESLPMTATGKVQKGRLRAFERRRVLGLIE